MSISDNIAVVKERIYLAAIRGGRDPRDVKLIAVTKAVGVDEINELKHCGICDVGENRVQVAEPKIVALNNANFCWHLIGTLQTNKVKKAVKLFSVIHSVDRIKLAREIAKRAGEIGKTIEILIEVNISGEENKSGVNELYLAEMLAECRSLEGVFVSGLMTMAPLVDDPEEARPIFRRLRQLADKQGLQHCSMGMSDDFEVAIEEGATIVRVGRALFK